MSDSLISIRYRNGAHNGGFAEVANFVPGTTAGQFLAAKEGLDNCVIMLSRRGQAPVPPLATDVLQDGDCLTVTPQNIKGA